MKIQIKARFTDAVIFEADISDDAPVSGRTRLAAEAAVRARANLYRANLSCADLSGADLSGANLSGANLYGANLSCANLYRANLYRADLSGAKLSGANLYRANLSCADLYRAKLSGADLSGANLSGAKLVGERPILQIGPIGSRCAYLQSFLTDAGVMVRAGCWYGDIAAFERRMKSEHGDNAHGREYAAAIAMIRAHATIWMPAEAVAA